MITVSPKDQGYLQEVNHENANLINANSFHLSLVYLLIFANIFRYSVKYQKKTTINERIRLSVLIFKTSVC